MWNELVMTVYEDWKDNTMKNDVRLQSLYKNDTSNEKLINDYIEDNYGYETFLDSEENQCLFDITKSALCKSIEDTFSSNAITVLNDNETWTGINDTKVVLLSGAFEYGMIDDANDLYDESFVFEDGTTVKDCIVEELSIPQLVNFYLLNRHLLN